MVQTIEGILAVAKRAGKYENKAFLNDKLGKIDLESSFCRF